MSRRPMFRDHQFVTIPVADEAQAAFEAFIRDHAAELDALFAPFGFGLSDLPVERLHQIVWEASTE